MLSSFLFGFERGVGWRDMAGTNVENAIVCRLMDEKKGFLSNPGFVRGVNSGAGAP